MRQRRKIGEKVGLLFCQYSVEGCLDTSCNLILMIFHVSLSFLDDAQPKPTAVVVAQTYPDDTYDDVAQPEEQVGQFTLYDLLRLMPQLGIGRGRERNGPGRGRERNGPGIGRERDGQWRGKDGGPIPSTYPCTSL